MYLTFNTIIVSLLFLIIKNDALTFHATWAWENQDLHQQNLNPQQSALLF